MIRRALWLIGICGWLMAGATAAPAQSSDVIVVGGKRFTEGYLLAELFAQFIEGNSPYRVERRFGLGGTKVCVEAITSGAIDLYPEYTGTIQEEILHSESTLDDVVLRRRLEQQLALEMGPSLGFNNTYALAVRRAEAERTGVRRISDLGAHSDWRCGFSHEFLERRDGWRAVAATYGLRPAQVAGLDHGLAYEALIHGETDIIDAYATDAKLDRYDLTILEDDRGFFPQYLAVPLWHRSLRERFPEVPDLFARLHQRIDDRTMRRLNAAVELDGRDIAGVVRDFLSAERLVTAATPLTAARTTVTLIVEHLALVMSALAASLLVGIPLGMVIQSRPRWSAAVLSLLGIIQTIPSIALLAFMIPLFGIGVVPAMIALFLYGLLPIVRQTVVGLRGVAPLLCEVAIGIGLSSSQRLRWVLLPMATPAIAAGIRTSAVINVGTATLAAFIGAGGLGEPIVTGLALNDTTLILRGAIPAAALALAMEWGLGAVEHLATPRGLRTRRRAAE